MVRDLWALRLQKFQGQITTQLEDEDDGAVFSSQGEFTSDTGEGEDEPPAFVGMTTRTPRLIESLGLCYLGALLMRIPLSIGQLQRLVPWDPFLRLNADSKF